MGKLTTHILDTSIGMPASEVEIRLYKRNDSSLVLIESTQTNKDGRCDKPLLSGEAFSEGCYEIEFLIDGISNISNPYHFFYLSTIDNKTITSRTIVLRNVEQNPLAVYFNADFRSPKVEQLLSNNICSILFYDNKRKMQLRANCKATIGTVSNADQKNIQIGKAGRNRWKGIRPQSRGVVMNPVDHPHGCLLYTSPSPRD